MQYSNGVSGKEIRDTKQDCDFCNGPVISCKDLKDPMGREEYVICWHCGSEYIRLLDD